MLFTTPSTFSEIVTTYASENLWGLERLVIENSSDPKEFELNLQFLASINVAN